MMHGSTRIATRGYCVYCLRKNVPLTDEHIVAYALGGRHVLEDASCEDCANITKKFEQDVMRGLWGDARASYNAPTRRPKERKETIALRDRTGNGTDLVVKMTDYPAAMVFYEMGLPGFLSGRSESEDTSPSWPLISIVDQGRLENFERQNPGRLNVQFRHVPNSFARMIAKIGYGQILTVLDPQDFEPVCLPYILGTRTNLSFIVGSTGAREPPTPGIGYSLETLVGRLPGELVLLARVRLVANNETPTYLVVVGTVRGIERIENVERKLLAQNQATAKSSS